MLYYLFFEQLFPYFTPFRVFRYVTFRTALASLTALLICLVVGPWLIARLKEYQIGQYIREEGPRSHQDKAGTPTMGGVLINVAILVPTLLWANLSNALVWMVILATLGFALVGFLDDYYKIRRQRSQGLAGRTKLYLQILISFLVGIGLVFLTIRGNYSTNLIVPFFKNFTPDLLIHSLMENPYTYPLAFGFFLLFVVLVIVGTSNAVNLTDGLDGLAAGCSIVAAGALTVLSYVTGHAVFARYLELQYVPQVAEVTIFCGAMVGACMGFLWYNSHPAEIFMGDVGSLALGGAIGTVAVIIKQEILLLLIAGVFVAEALSVILQVASFQLWGRRLFHMAPLHHHFEMKGWSESKVIIRFWIAALVLALFSLSTLKLR
ncbi:MAG: phospho-N-acetylmuramoyl-pentapeptide-transferase [Acidobacteria bacterium]|nr:phospho-N-acetylmuramoyl-pentapeptide-transferase [Acidobacteriota bacterium]MCZ6752380.1 phospho-N-acetylmuramoyl-pentapeptide-transferase [Acidobacteriota bacterium]